MELGFVIFKQCGLSLYLATIDQRLSDRHLIDIFQLIAKAQTARDGRNLHRRIGTQAVQNIEQSQPCVLVNVDQQSVLLSSHDQR